MNSVLNIKNYEILPELRKDRSDTRQGIGGGLLVYIKQGHTVLSHDCTIDFNQYLHFSVKTNNETTNIFLVYKSPNCSNYNNDKLIELISSMPDNSIVIGDFNYPKINWSENIAADTVSQSFLDICNENNFNQFVTFPTHVKNNVLDLVLSNNDSILEVSDLGPLCNSDHTCIKIVTDHSILPENSQQEILDWGKADYQKINEDLAKIDWDRIISNDVEMSWRQLTEVINELICRYVPNKTIKTNKPRWMTKEIITLGRKKDRAYKKWKRTKNLSDEEHFTKLSKECKKKIKSAKKKLEVKISKSSGNSGQRKFNSYVKNKMSCKPSVGPLIHDDKVITNNAEMAQTLNDHFCSSFNDDNDYGPNIPKRNMNSELSHINVRLQDVLTKIDELKTGKAPGPDRISGEFLKKTKKHIARPLQKLFQASISTGKVPGQWKDAKVAAVFKKGSRGKPGNYRQISLTSQVCKLNESIIRDHMIDHLIINSLIKPSQHGFMPKRSCQTNLLEFLDKIFEMTDEGNPVDIAYLDFSRAFDKVPHNKLIQKLEAHGITGSVQEWIISWLKDRTQWVEIQGAKSRPGKVRSGVPQGSILGPVLFVIYINDLDDDIIIDILRKFADDTKQANKIRNQADADSFQFSLNRLFDWSKTWGMLFNIDKCKILHCGRNNPKNEYYMDNIKLGTVESERDIGIRITSNLKPTTHCNEIVNKAKAVLNQISRSFHYRDKNVFIRLYKQYVRPHLEFSSSVWNPWNLADIKNIEAVQIKAIKMVSGLQSQDYHERLKELNLWTLEKRRKFADLVQCYKILHNIGNVKCGLKTVNVAQNRATTRQNSDILNLKKGRANSDVRLNFFSFRIVDPWNSLPSEIKHATSVANFRSKLKQYMN